MDLDDFPGVSSEFKSHSHLLVHMFKNAGKEVNDSGDGPMSKFYTAQIYHAVSLFGNKLGRPSQLRRNSIGCPSRSLNWVNEGRARACVSKRPQSGKCQHNMSRLGHRGRSRKTRGIICRPRHSLSTERFR